MEENPQSIPSIDDIISFINEKLVIKKHHIMVRQKAR